jgi:hypothetical protein
MIEQTATFELLNPQGERELCSASFDVSHNEVTMKTSSAAAGDKAYTARDAFDALELFRREIEPLGWRVLCNGARKDRVSIRDVSRHGPRIYGVLHSA